MVEAAGDDEKELAAQMAAEFLNEDLSEQQFGAPKAGPAMWASLLRMIDPIKVNIEDSFFPAYLQLSPSLIALCVYVPFCFVILPFLCANSVGDN